MKRSAASTGWWERWPHLHAREIDAYAHHGAAIVDEQRVNGLLLLEVDWPAKEGVVRLHVGYSPLHPFSRPEVAAPALTLDRHQNPFSGALCLLTQESGQWDPRELVADMIARQLPKIGDAIEARAEGENERAGALEEQAPDPLTPYFAGLFEPASAVFFDGDQRVPPSGFGFAEFLVQGRTVIADPMPVDIVLSRVTPPTGRWLGAVYDLPQRVGEPQKVQGRWVRLDGPIPHDPDAILEAAHAELGRLAGLDVNLRGRLDAVAAQPFSVTAILVREELAYGEYGNGWLFAVSRQQAGRRRKVTLVRGMRVSADMFSRLPIAGALRDKKVLVVGCGAIGAFAAIELARAGVGTVVLSDYDVVEPGNSVRWPLGRSSWGLGKTIALQQFLVHNYPFTKAVALVGRIGAATSDLTEAKRADGDPTAVLRKEIATSDVVVDASASTECQQAIAFLAREAKKPLVVGYGTLGAAGGVVARFPAGSPACLVCLSEHWADGTLPQPAVDHEGEVLPVGCNAPTFAGGAFDLQEVSLEMVRSAIGMMVPDAYDAGAWQLSTLTLRVEGRRVLPRWTADGIAPHPRCACGRL